MVKLALNFFCTANAPPQNNHANEHSFECLSVVQKKLAESTLFTSFRFSLSTRRRSIAVFFISVNPTVVLLLALQYTRPGYRQDTARFWRYPGAGWVELCSIPLCPQPQSGVFNLCSTSIFSSIRVFGRNAVLLTQGRERNPSARTYAPSSLKTIATIRNPVVSLFTQGALVFTCRSKHCPSVRRMSLHAHFFVYHHKQ